MRAAQLKVDCNLVGKHRAKYPAQQGSGAPAAQDTASNVSSDQSLAPKTVHEQAQAGIGQALGQKRRKCKQTSSVCSLHFVTEGFRF